MIEKDWFEIKLSHLQDYYAERAQENVKALAAADKKLADEKAKHADLVRDLCRALDRAQEIIVELGERSGNADVLKDAKVYANVIGGLTTDVGSPSVNSYLDDPFIKDHWKKVVAQHNENKKELAKRKKTTSKRQRRAK